MNDKSKWTKNLAQELEDSNVKQDSNWSRGITSPGFGVVPYTFCKERQGSSYTLPHRCWEDIFDAINNATHMIYIAGWSVYTKVTLIRNPKRQKIGEELTLGELLKKKASEGVNVLLLVWYDITSNEILKRDGLMSTHDQESTDYFKNIVVHRP
ncbi:hypothetical protein H5410_022172 [Solanum commersonii]|uniref:Phospholipase D n=1 Tax=Solanum commersonii TaxID=4109 RepID=A0A9J5ZD67_SOLCO|nr:hypothetical protein H5410_022172 [Solanum commersonii]